MPGHEENTYTDELLYSVLVQHRQAPFAREIFNIIVSAVMHKFNEGFSALQRKGMSHHDALIEALAHSPFSENVGLYCRLTGEKVSAEELAAIDSAVKMSGISVKYTQKILDLETRCKQAEERLSSVLEECRAFVDEHEQFKQSAEEKLHAMQTISRNLQDLRRSAEKDHRQKLAEIEAVYSQKEAEAAQHAGYFSSGQPLTSPNTKIHDAFGDSLKSIAVNLLHSGVVKDSCAYLAQMMYSMFCRKTPLLLAGPNGSDMVQAFSSAVFAKSPGELLCEGSFSRKVLEGEILHCCSPVP